MITITIEPAGEQVPGAAERTILDACIEAGLPMPYNCRSGECGECMADLTGGAVHELPGADPAIFTEADRAAGRILTCMCYPRGDVALQVRFREGDAAIRPRHVEAVVRAIERVTPTIWEVAVETPEPLEFRAGQCFEWVVPGIAPNRTYSAANRPGTAAIVFHVRRYPGGRIGAFIESGLKPGDRLGLHGPFGQFALSANDFRPALCVGGGTGLAPLVSVLEDAFARDDGRPVTLFYGARDQSELYCLDRLTEWAETRSTFRFVPVLSAEPEGSGWAGHRGLVTEVMEREMGDAFGAEAYVCGPPAMIDAAQAVLEAAGVAPEDIHCDRFVAAKAG